eukprot:764385-Hanusia_phi.AAC.2
MRGLTGCFQVIACIVAHDINQGEWVAQVSPALNSLSALTCPCLQVPFFPPAQDGTLEAEECHDLIAAIIGAQRSETPSEGKQEGSNVSSGLAEDGKTISWKLCSWRPWSMDAMIASKYSVDRRIFLVGDAAHQFPPSGGFGLNCGLQVPSFYAPALPKVTDLGRTLIILLGSWHQSFDAQRVPPSLIPTTWSGSLLLGTRRSVLDESVMCSK